MLGVFILKMKKWLGFSGLLLLILVLTSCGCTKKQPIEEEPVEEIVEEENFAYVYPLTGIGTNDDVDGRAVAVVINNHPKARQQSGLHQADIVYEVMAEGKVTRFLAIFQSEQPERVGPVRSARNYYIELAKGYNSLFVAHGYSPDAYALLQSGYIDELNGMSYDGSLFKRASSRQAPHNSYITFANILKGGEQKHYDLTTPPRNNLFLTEEEIENMTGNHVSAVSVSYSSSLFNVKYEYDEQLEKFTRSSNGEQTVDDDSKDPVLLDNIFIVETSHRVVDDEGRLAVDLTSGGNGYLLQKGKWNEVQWKNESGRIIPFVNGKIVPFVPGKTWINFVPNTPGLSQAVSIE